MARARILRALVALYVVAILSPLLTTSFGHSCALGRFMIDDASGPGVGPIELRDGNLFLAAGCNPAPMTVIDEGRDGTRVRTAWASCGSDSRRVNARIDAACDVLRRVA